MAPPSAAENLHALKELLSSTLAILTQFRSSLTPTASAPSIPNPPNPLPVLRDSALLLKAHTTKLSLLAINKPFTPTAVTKVLRELSGTCLPAMLSAVQICSQEEEKGNEAKAWGATLPREVRARVGRVFRELEVLLLEVQGIADGGGVSPASKDSLRSTGVVWEACDALVELEKLGLAGLAVRQAEQYRDAVRDAIEELRGWREGTDLENEGLSDQLLDEEDEAVDGDKDSLEDIFNAASSLPKDRPELRELVESAEGTLKKIVLLYTALGKRRFKTFKVGSVDGRANVDRLDRILHRLKVVQSDVDDLAGCFYELSEESAKETLEKCLSGARLANETARLGWDGTEDEFTAWSKKWEEAVG